MYIDVVESLRCPKPHDESALVGVFASVDGRDVVEGVLGCPVCQAEYPIRDGVAWFTDTAHAAWRPAGAADEHEAIRIAAFLNLTEATGFAVLQGRWAAHAPIVNGLSPTHLVLLDPVGDMPRAPGITIIRALPAVPLGRGSALAAAIDGPDIDASPPDGADRERAVAIALAAVVRPGGRLIGPATMPIPPDAHELMRDASVWIAERDAPERVIPLLRRRDA